MDTPAKPVALILHGPSGVGKDAIIDELGIHRPLSTTDRRPRRRAEGHRDDETDGVHYHFVSPHLFSALVADGRFGEWARVYDHRKGLELREVQRAIASGDDFVIRTDVQGAATWKAALEGAVTLLVLGVDPAAPVAEHTRDLEARLRFRQETQREIDLRLAALPGEIAGWRANDYVVVNRWGGLEEAVAEVRAIVARERHNPERPPLRLRGR